MFAHIFKYRLKCLLRTKELLFWTLLFPILLGTFFYMAFGKLDENTNFAPIKIAVVNNETYSQNTDFSKVLRDHSKGENPYFDLKETSLEEAGKLLLDGDIIAYIHLDPEIKMVVRSSGLYQNILKIFIEQYTQTGTVINDVLTNHPENMEALLGSASNSASFTRETSVTDSKMNQSLNYFYSLIAMACMYGSFWGLKEINDIQANLTPLAARVNMAPVHKLKAFIYSMSAALLIIFTEMMLLLAYIIFVLGISFGNKTGLVILTTFIGSLVGLTFGAFISSNIKKGEGIKMAILLGISMLGSFLAGMMYDKMKYIVANDAPIVGYLNPVNLLTDAYYSLYYYDTFDRYWLNIGILGIFIVVFSLGTFLILRRRKYASL